MPQARSTTCRGLFCRNDPGDLTQRTVSELAALLPTMPDDCATPGTPANGTGDGPFCKAAYAHPSVYPLGGTARVCVSQQGFATGAGNTIFPWTEFVDEADAYLQGR